MWRVQHPVIAWLQDCVSHLCQLPALSTSDEACPPSPSAFSPFHSLSPSSPPFSSIHPFSSSSFPSVLRIGLGVSYVLGRYTTELHPGFTLPLLYRTAWRLSWHLSVSVEDQAGAINLSIFFPRFHNKGNVFLPRV